MRTTRDASWALLALLPALTPALAGSAPHIPDVLSQEIARFRRLMASPAAGYRVEGVQGAAQLRLPSFEPDLLRLVGDRDPTVAQTAVAALARCGTWQSVPRLIALLECPDWAVREHASLGLRRLTGRTFDGLDNARWERWWAATSLEHKQAELLK